MIKKNDNYPVLPHIAYGLCEDVKGLYILLPIAPISLNVYKKMHFGAVKKEKEHAKAIVDVILASCINKNFIKEFTKNGLLLSQSVINKCEVTWFLTFLNRGEHRDTDNYVQKIFMDAVVSSGIIKNDDERYITRTTVEFKKKKVNSATLFLKGDVNEDMFMDSMRRVKYQTLMEFLDDER